MAFTQNFNSNTFGPVYWELMGPIADRPATADLHTTYVSTDEGNGVLKAYLYTESGWMQMQGIEGFTGGGGGSGGGSVFTINFTTDDGWSTIEADKTFAETLAAVNSGATVYAIALEMTEGAVSYAFTLPCISASDATISHLTTITFRRRIISYGCQGLIILRRAAWSIRLKNIH